MMQQIDTKAADTGLHPEDALRASVYRLLARFLSSPPGPDELRAAAALHGDATPFGTAIATFSKVAASCAPGAAADEYSELFIGVARGELIPYGSYYLTGFLHEKPLAKLRQDMDRLGLVRVAGIMEPEDHVSSVLEIMAGLIDGMPGPKLSLTDQRQFFNSHLNSWMPVFFKDLAAARTARLYAALAGIGQNFLLIEEEAFAMV